MHSSSMDDFWTGLGIAFVILACCFGYAGCYKMMREADAIKTPDTTPDTTIKKDTQ